MTDGPDSMQWPTMRHKLGGAGFLWFGCSLGWSVDFRNWYYGHWLWLSMGRLVFRCGRGTYGDD